MSGQLRACVAAAAFVCAVLPGAAQAEANGFKFGNARLHPFFDLELRFDSAAVSVPTTGTAYSIASDLLVHFRPGLKLEMPTTGLFTFNLNGNVDYVWYTGVINSGTRSASHLAADADLDLGINRDGQFGVDIGDHFTRSDRTNSTPGAGVGFLSLYNDARLKVNIRPYRGAISIEPGYHFTAEVFELLGAAGTTTVDPKDYDYLNHNIQLGGRWKFLPKTAMLLDTSFGIRNALSANATSKEMLTLKAMLGAGGLLTTHWEVLLKLGWGYDFTHSTYSSIIGQAEVGYLLSETSAFRLGYIRTFEPTGGDFLSYGVDRFYLDGRMLFGGKLTARGNVGVDILSFAGASSSKGQVNLVLDLGAEYEVLSWLNVAAGYTLTYYAGTNVYYNLNNFTRNEGYLRVRFIY